MMAPASRSTPTATSASPSTRRRSTRATSPPPSASTSSPSPLLSEPDISLQGDDLLPNIVQPEEIPDPSEKKPEDWDEREKIPDPEAVKPEDWDESAPETIEDAEAEKPADWLEEEEPLIPDPAATKPDDWDAEMDGDWEPARIPNPKCEAISGCGKWERPTIRNPAYKGKWKAPLIKNPNYQVCFPAFPLTLAHSWGGLKGKWKPQMVKNPSYFDAKAKAPFHMLTPIVRPCLSSPTALLRTWDGQGALGLELWTMSEGLAFDNFLITDDVSVADAWTEATWGPKKAQEAKEIGKVGPSTLLSDRAERRREPLQQTFFGGLTKAAEEKPWLWAVYLLVILIPLVLITVCCYPSKKVLSFALSFPPSASEGILKDKDLVGEAKKSDAPQADDDEGEAPPLVPQAGPAKSRDELEQVPS